MHLKELLLRFNVSHFTFYSTLLLLSVLVGLRIDGVISAPYSVLFLPLWLWNVTMVLGLVLGIIRWAKSSEQRQEDQFLYQFKSMISSVILQSFIILMEVMGVVNLDVGGTPIPWSAVFGPVYLLMIISIPFCIWGCYRKQGIEIEILAMSGFVQFIFLGIRLDNVVQWNWGIVLIPFWLMYTSLLVVLVIVWIAMILSYLVGENQTANEERKLPDIAYFVSTALLSVCVLVFMILLVVRLNGDITIKYSIVFIPLHFSLLTLMGTAFSRKPANVWWFGIRRNFTDAVLDCCPSLQHYANVSYKKEHNPADHPREGMRKTKKKKLIVDIEKGGTNYPYEDIYMPD